MPELILAMLAMAIAVPPAPSGQSESAIASNNRPAARTAAQWREDVRSALREQATAKDLDQPIAVIRLALLYVQLGQDGQLSHSEQKRLRMSIRNRLVRIRDEIAPDLQHRLAKIDVVKQRAKQQKQPELLEKIKDDQAVLAQWNGVLAQFGGGAAVGGGPPVAAGAADSKANEGQQLVDLIQAVITPDAWTANGGSAAIVYYPPVHALVISATTDTQEEVANLLEALRRAGN